MSELISMSPLNSDTSALLLSQIAKYSSHIKWGVFFGLGVFYFLFLDTEFCLSSLWLPADL